MSGTIPPNSLAVGSPAKVIRSAPDFPKKVSEDERARLIAEMLSEFDRYVTYERTSIEREGEFRTYRSRAGAWRLYQHQHGTQLPPMRRSDTVLTDVELTTQQRDELRARGAHWLDLRGKTRSDAGSPLTEELASFISRYGIRLPRA